MTAKDPILTRLCELYGIDRNHACYMRTYCQRIGVDVFEYYESKLKTKQELDAIAAFYQVNAGAARTIRDKCKKMGIDVYSYPRRLKKPKTTVPAFVEQYHGVFYIHKVAGKWELTTEEVAAAFARGDK